MLTPEDVLAALQAIARELEATHAECVAKHAPDVKGFKTELALVGDPDVGTLIDAATPIVDGSGAPLPPALDDCVRSAFQTLALPPMATGDKYMVTLTTEL